MGGLTRRLGVLGLLGTIALGLVPTASAASWATFGTPTAKSTYGTGVEFSQPVTVARPIGRVELLVTIADSPGPIVFEVEAPSGAGSTTLSDLFVTSGGAHQFPNTRLTARWRITAEGDPTDVQLGPVVRVTYADDQFAWQTETGSLVRVHWYQGTTDFGRRALKLGEDALRTVSDLFGVTESSPVDFFVYADEQAFSDAIDPSRTQNVGGEAPPIPGLRTLFALIPPSEINDPVRLSVIPHELTHLVVETVAGNPYHAVPHWLNEGLAVYESQGYDTSDRALVSGALSSGTLIPLDALASSFPTGDGFFLGYAESVSAVEFMVRSYDAHALVTLIRSYKDGRTDDEAFQKGLGVDTAAFESAWLDSLGAAPPTRYGPQPAPAGPIPSAWLAGGQVTTPTSAVTGGPSLLPAVSPQASVGANGGGLGATVVVGALAGVIIAMVLLPIVWRRRRRAPSVRPPMGGPEA